MEMSIKVIGWRIRCTESDSSNGLTVKSITENSEVTKDAGTATLSGQMEVHIMGSGKMENSMDMGYIPISLENKEREPGQTVEGSTGHQINDHSLRFI